MAADGSGLFGFLRIISVEFVEGGFQLQGLVITETKGPKLGDPYCAHHNIVLLKEEVEAKRCIEKKCPHFGYLKQIVRF